MPCYASHFPAFRKCILNFSENLCKTVVEAGSIKSIIKFLRSDNSDLQFWASSLLLNLSMASDEARESIIKEGGIGILLEMAVKESEMPQIMAQASKILVMLGFSGNMFCKYYFFKRVMKGLIENCDLPFLTGKTGLDFLRLGFGKEKVNWD